MKRHTEETRRFIAAGEELRLTLTHETPDRLPYCVRVKRGAEKAGLLSAHAGPVAAREAYEDAAKYLLTEGWAETRLREKLVTIPRAPGAKPTESILTLEGGLVTVALDGAAVFTAPCAHPKLAHLLPTRPPSRSLDCEDCGAMVPGTMGAGA